MKTGISKKAGLAFCNLGAITLLVGILLAFIFPTNADNKFSAAVTGAIDELKQANIPFDESKLTEYTFCRGKLKLEFSVSSGVNQVVFDQKERTIVSITRIP